MTKVEYIERYGIEWYETHVKTKNKEYQKSRYTNDVEWRETRKVIAREYSKERYANDSEYRETHIAKSIECVRVRRTNDSEFALKSRLYNTLYKYCRADEYELIENYELAKVENFIGWDIHHRDEIKTLPSGMVVYRSKQELIENGRYYNCPANELIFLRHSEHSKLHRDNHS